jgi:hypothetical protein
MRKLQDAQEYDVRSRSVLSYTDPATPSRGLEPAWHRKEIDKISGMNFENRYLPEKPYPI